MRFLLSIVHVQCHHYRYPPLVYSSCPHLFLASTQSQFFGNGKRSCVNADPKKKKSLSLVMLTLWFTHEIFHFFFLKNKFGTMHVNLKHSICTSLNIHISFKT